MFPTIGKSHEVRKATALASAQGLNKSCVSQGPCPTFLYGDGGRVVQVIPKSRMYKNRCPMKPAPTPPSSGKEGKKKRKKRKHERHNSQSTGPPTKPQRSGDT